MKRLFAIVLAVFSLASCYKLSMDPYEGGDGVRANIDGRKCVMMGTVGSRSYASYSVYTDSCVFLTQVPLANRILAEDATYRLSIKLKTGAAIAVDQDYSLAGEDATILFPGKLKPEALSGWIRFSLLDPAAHLVEATFELSSADHSVKHGFIRLPIEYVNHAGS